jgi:L-lysine 2,3-aminomutase
MSAKRLEGYLLPLLEADLPNLRSIRIGTKALGYWPYRVLTDPDADDVLRLFEKVVNKGIHLALMGHFSHPNELKTDAVKQAIARVLSTGAKIRTQSPVMRHINDKVSVWKDMWTTQVNLGCIPYYMFVARDTGAQDYFAVSLERAHQIFRGAYQEVSGLARTVRGPSMSAMPGKVQILGINEIHGEKVFTLRFIQARNPSWVGRPFFATYNKQAIWLDDLSPAFGRQSFFFDEREVSELNVA